MKRQKDEKMIIATKYNTPDLYLRIWAKISISGSFVINSIIMIIVACIRNTYQSVPLYVFLEL